MSGNVVTPEVDQLSGWRTTTIVEILKQSFAAHPALVGSPGVFISTAISRHAQEMAQLYTEAFHRGDWAAAEFKPYGKLMLTAESFEIDANFPSNLWVMFTDEGERLLGATKLVVDPLAGTLIDETQIDPRLGRGRHIMPSYFRRIIPILNSLGLPYWTEFMLTPGSRVLRKCLISELGMVVTGLRPACYSSEQMTVPRSVLVAHGPAASVDSSMCASRYRAAAVFQPLLDVIARGIESDYTLWPSRATSSDQYQEVEVPEADYKLACRYLQEGYLPVALDPVSRTYTLAQFPRTRGVCAELSFLHEEGIDEATRLLNYLTKAEADSKPSACATVPS